MTTDAMKETLAEAYAGAALYVTLHTGPPGTDGSNALSGPRQPLTWTTSGGVAVSDPASFTIPSGTDLTDVGIWGSLSGTDFLDSIPNPVSFPSGGTYDFILNYTPG